MGAGVEVAKEAAAAVLLDSRLATLIAGIREGRGAYLNIQKALDYLLTCSVATMLAVLLTTAAGFPLPLAPLQILYLNLLTHSFPALGLALEPAGADRLAHGPLPRHAPILTAARLGSIVWHALMIAVVTLAVGAWGLAHQSEAHGRTLVFATLASALMLHAFSDRSPRPFGGWRLAGWPFYALLGTAVALQLAAIYTPGLAAALSLTPIWADDWLGVAAAAAIATAAVEVSKRVLPPDWPDRS
ncbi:Calcium-transporting ATPase [compost metagenome]